MPEPADQTSATQSSPTPEPANRKSATQTSPTPEPADRTSAAQTDTTPESALPERTFGWSDMFVAPADDPRADSSEDRGERATLLSYLADYRLTLGIKCAGLDAAGMAARSVPPSNLSLLGLVRHLAHVEHSWFRRVLAGQDVPRLWTKDDARDADFDDAVADPAMVEEAWAVWRGEVAFAEEFAGSAPSLDVTGTMADGEQVSLRVVLVHMIEEYARHMGHADLLRERIDGRVGQ